MKRSIWISLLSLPLGFLVLHFFFFPSFHDDGQILVAVIDSGVDYEHEELKGRVMKGIDLVDGDKDPMDENGHGTHVASQILDRTKETKVLAIRTLDEKGKGKGNSFRAVLYALHKGADVVNMSYSESYNPFIRVLLWYGEKRGVVFVASTGNDGKETINYPASYKSVIPIGAINENRDVLYEEGNINDSVKFVAPGVIAYILENHPEMTRDELLMYLENHTDITKEGTFHQLEYDRFAALEDKTMPYGKVLEHPEITDQHVYPLLIETLNVEKIEGYNEQGKFLFFTKNWDDSFDVPLTKEGYQQMKLRFYNGAQFQEKTFGIIKDTKAPSIQYLSAQSGVLSFIFTETTFKEIIINGKNANSFIQRNRQEDYSYQWTKRMEEDETIEIEIRDKVGNVTKEIIHMDKTKK